MSDLILIVDDEEDLREVVRALLELNGFRVIEAENANEMFSQVKENDISLILLDIGLPENDGLSALKKMRPDSDIPIVLLTGKGDVIDKVVGLELGADDYITKPFHSHELIARVKTYYAAHQPPSHLKLKTTIPELLLLLMVGN
ncbi:MAG: response regulator [Kordiimonadaceae bacterium]|nr:response regulator [Kordiimonadaceae bacterium]